METTALHAGCFHGCQLTLAPGTEVTVTRYGVRQYPGNTLTVVGHHRGSYIVREAKYNTTCHHLPSELSVVEKADA